MSATLTACRLLWPENSENLSDWAGLGLLSLGPGPDLGPDSRLMQGTTSEIVVFMIQEMRGHC